MTEIVDGLNSLLAWPHPLYLLAAGAFGFFMGVLPGLGGAMTLVLLLPLTIGMSPETALVVLLGAYGLVGTGGMVSAVVINTPGTAENAATTLDGYPLMRAGRGPEALGVGAMSSTIGALVGVAVLVAVFPLARPLVLALSYPEYLLLAVLGLSVIAVVTETTVARGLIAAGFGFLISFVGLDPVLGQQRFTFDQLFLWEGFPLVPVLIGLFAGGEVVALYRDRPVARLGGTEDRIGSPDVPRTRSTYWMGTRAVLASPWGSIRGGLIGTTIGLVPAVGGVVASFLSYGTAKRLSKTPENFGRGSFEGLAASESANDAKEGGALVPTIAFGIPGSIGTAIILGALLFHGIPAGPTLLRDNPQIIITLILTMFASKLLAPFYVGLLGPGARRFASVSETSIVPIIVVVVFAGALASNLRPVDAVLLLIFGYVGHSFVVHRYSRIAFVIALVLGGLVERSYHQMMLTFDSPLAVVQRPISAGLLALVVTILLGRPVASFVRRRRGGAAPARESDSEVVSDGPPRPVSGFTFNLLLLSVSATALVVSFVSLADGAALVPRLVIVPTFVGMLVLVVQGARGLVRGRKEARDPAMVGTASPVTSASGSDNGASRSEVTRWIGQVARGKAVLGDAPWPAMREAVIGAWALLLLILILVVGFFPAVLAALLIYCLVIQRFAWPRSLAIVGPTWLALYLMFVVGLGVPL